MAIHRPLPTTPAGEAATTATPTGTVAPEAARRHTVTGAVLATARVALGFVFLWAFLDKLFGLHYATGSGKGWIDGGSPTRGFLSHVAAGPFQSTFRSWAGAGWADTLFMLGLLGIGVALIAGVAMRIAAASGVLMMAFMWLAEWPLAQHTSAGAPTGSNNPIVDYHLIYALLLLVLAVTAAGDHLGLGRWWAKLPIIRDHASLR
jgi:thiosulfate dehydrogenase (quinone) large subunit